MFGGRGGGSALSAGGEAEESGRRGPEAVRPGGRGGRGGLRRPGRRGPAWAAVSRCARGRRDGCRRLAEEAGSGRRDRGGIAEAEAAAGWGWRGTRRPRRGRGDRGVEGGLRGAGGAAKRMEPAAGLRRRGSSRAGRALGVPAVCLSGRGNIEAGRRTAEEAEGLGSRGVCPCPRP